MKHSINRFEMEKRISENEKNISLSPKLVKDNTYKIRDLFGTIIGNGLCLVDNGKNVPLLQPSMPFEQGLIYSYVDIQKYREDLQTGIQPEQITVGNKTYYKYELETTKVPEIIIDFVYPNDVRTEWYNLVGGQVQMFAEVSVANLFTQEGDYSYIYKFDIGLASRLINGNGAVVPVKFCVPGNTKVQFIDIEGMFKIEKLADNRIKYTLYLKGETEPNFDRITISLGYYIPLITNAKNFPTIK